MFKQLDLEETMVVATGDDVSKSLEKHFNYEMTDKKAKSNLVKGASREVLEIEEMQKCTMLIFSVGAYYEVIIPSVAEWKIGTKIMNNEIKNVIPGFDENNKHMQTIIKVLCGKNMVTVTCFNSTQKIKVEGNGYQEFVKTILDPLIKTRLNRNTLENIEKYNRDVIAALSGKRKALSRPTRSVKYKAMAKFSCTKCDTIFSNKTTLARHRKIVHTRGADDSRHSMNNIPIVDDISLLEITSNEEKDAIKAITMDEACSIDKEKQTEETEQGHCVNKAEKTVVVVEKSPKSKSLFRCTSCEYSSWIEIEFESHMNSKHRDEKTFLTEPPTVKTQCDFIKIEELSCRSCEFEADCPETLQEHINSIHTTELEEHCGRCGFLTNREKDIDTHFHACHKFLKVDIKKIDNQEIKIRCDQCEYVCRFNKQFQKKN